MRVSGKIDEWIVFVKVVETGSFSLAAQELNTSVSSVSKKISRLEEGVNSHLLHRDTRSIELTEAGMIAYEKAVVIIEMMTDLVHNLRNPSGTIEGSIRLTAPAMVCEFLANYWLDEYADRHKGVTVFLESRESSQFTKESSAFDHLVLKSGIIECEDLIHRELNPLKLSLCAARGYVSRYGKPQHPSELLKHRFLHLYHHGLSGELEFFKDGETFTFKNLNQTGFLTDSLLATFNLMLQERGISLISSGFLLRKPENYNQVITLLDDWMIPPVPVYLVWRQRKYYSPLFRDFVNFISEKWNNRDSISQISIQTPI
ncbi:LysR family transcriptional regulator [Pantoea stewartii]|uniref:LysR family transcriptional regulator n=1 Tax=Pantoea TaxID=53335 RepID=UPI000799D071|nr:LysR family transcriptional regulator [Pantoea stewartii]KTS25154.1 hypothetical protein NS381_21470 [Pantoea stewartii]